MRIEDAARQFEEYIKEGYDCEEVPSDAAMDMALTALEKQILKEPAMTIQKDDIQIGNATWKAGTKVCMCMSCYHWVSPGWTYCPDCGQRLKAGDRP